MHLSRTLLLNLIVSILVTICFTLQIISLTTTHWALFDARTELGKPKETGHYGLWNLCVTRLPHYVEDCDSLDTFFQVPQYLKVAGALAIIHVLKLLSLLPLSCIRFVQITRSTQNILIKSKILSIGTVFIAFIAVIFAILVAILASIGENSSVEYSLTKGWSFWIQIYVICIDFAVVVLCAIQNFIFWYNHIKDNADPMGDNAETYDNPYGEEISDFSSNCDANSRTDFSIGSISFTEASGKPYVTMATRPKERQPINSTNSNLIKNKARSRTHCDVVAISQSNSSAMLTYENPSFQEHSPHGRRSFQLDA